MRYYRVLLMVGGAALVAGPVLAQSARTQPIVSACSECDGLAQELRTIREQLAAVEAQLRDAEASQRGLESQKIDIELEIQQLTRSLRPSAATSARLQVLHAQLAGLGPALEAIAARVSELLGKRYDALAEHGRVWVALRECNARCKKAVGEPPPGGGVADGPPQPPAPPPAPQPETPAPKAECKPCIPAAEQLARLEAERQRLAEQIARIEKELSELGFLIDRNQSYVNELKSSADPRPGTADLIKATEQRIETFRAQEKAFRESRLKLILNKGEVEREIPRVRRELEQCNSSCQLPTNMKWYVIGGAGVAGLLATTVGGSPNLTTPPATAPTPVAQQLPPQPQPQPAPPSAPVNPFAALTGPYDCIECGVTQDPSGHDREFPFCSHAGGLWEVEVDVATISIRHTPPFVNANRLTLGPSGDFQGVSRGVFAGFSVGIEIVGRADPTTGRIRFTYTFGTGGELPGGRPVTYTLTLQQRR